MSDLTSRVQAIDEGLAVQRNDIGWSEAKIEALSQDELDSMLDVDNLNAQQ